MNEAWRLAIEIMDYDSIEALSRTNSSFKKYVEQDSEYIYKTLLTRDFDCVKGYRDLYLLLRAGKVKNTEAYKNKCVQEGLHLNCDDLMKDVNRFVKIGSFSIRNTMNFINSVINCLEKDRRLNKSRSFAFIISLDEMLRRNNENDVAKTSKAWRNWYPIAMNRLQELHTPRRN